MMKKQATDYAISQGRFGASNPVAHTGPENTDGKINLSVCMLQVRSLYQINLLISEKVIIWIKFLLNI